MFYKSIICKKKNLLDQALKVRVKGFKALNICFEWIK